MQFSIRYNLDNKNCQFTFFFKLKMLSSKSPRENKMHSPNFLQQSIHCLTSSVCDSVSITWFSYVCLL